MKKRRDVEQLSIDRHAIVAGKGVADHPGAIPVRGERRTLISRCRLGQVGERGIGRDGRGRIGRPPTNESSPFPMSRYPRRIAAFVTRRCSALNAPPVAHAHAYEFVLSVDIAQPAWARQGKVNTG